MQGPINFCPYSVPLGTATERCPLCSHTKSLYGKSLYGSIRTGYNLGSSYFVLTILTQALAGSATTLLLLLLLLLLLTESRDLQNDLRSTDTGIKSSMPTFHHIERRGPCSLADSEHQCRDLAPSLQHYSDDTAVVKFAVTLH